MIGGPAMSDITKSWGLFIFCLAGCLGLLLYRQAIHGVSRGPIITSRHGNQKHLVSSSDINHGSTTKSIKTKARDVVIHAGLQRNFADEQDSISLSKSYSSLDDQNSENSDYEKSQGSDKGTSDESFTDIWRTDSMESMAPWKQYQNEFQSWQWKSDSRSLLRWRKGLENYGVNSRKDFLITHDSVQQLQVLPFYLSTQHSYTVSDLFLRLIPKKSPYTQRSLGSCAVVGNSGILLHSGCGRHIDAADYVFRCNVPPLRAFKEDVGLKTNLTSMNPSMFRFDSSGTISLSRENDELYNEVLEPYHGVILMSCFSHFFYLRHCVKAIKQYYLENANMTFIHPKHFGQIWRYWENRNMTNLPSTGFYLVNVAATLCDEVHLYGFWPFDTAAFSGQPEHVMYHYYEEGHWRPAHDMNGEFQQLLQLHKEGALQIHLGNCSESGTHQD